MAGACAEAKLDAPPSVVYRDKDSGRKTLHYKVNVDRGVTWKRSLEILENALAEHKEIENHRLKRMEANGSKGNSRRWRSIIEPSYFVTKHSFQGKYFVLLAQEKFESVVNSLIYFFYIIPCDIKDLISSLSNVAFRAWKHFAVLEASNW